MTQRRVLPWRRLVAAIACAAFIGGCGSGTGPDTATPTMTPPPTAATVPLPSTTATVAPTETTPPAPTPTLAAYECGNACDCYATRRFAAPCPLECATCGNFWTCEQSRCLEHCGMVPLDVCDARCSRNEQCTSDTYCQKPVAGCDGPGACRRRPEACPAIEDPVCGCDGRTYSNQCYAGWDGVAIAHRRPCEREPTPTATPVGEPTPTVAACDVGDPCPGGFVSVRVLDPGVGPVSGVEVAITGTDLVAETNQEGIATFEIAPGSYFVDARVCCAGPGFIEHHVPITVESGKTVAVDLRACLRCICASPDTPIATPNGETPMYALAVGDLVYSIHDGQIVAVPIQETNRVAVHGHRVVRVSLATGAVLEISPGHPTADGRTVGDLRSGDRLAGVEVLAVEIVPYTYEHTYDILPASDSGVYFAGGIPLGSTLHHIRRPAR